MSLRTRADLPSSDHITDLNREFESLLLTIIYCSLLCLYSYSFSFTIFLRDYYNCQFTIFSYEFLFAPPCSWSKEGVVAGICRSDEFLLDKKVYTFTKHFCHTVLKLHIFMNKTLLRETGYNAEKSLFPC